MSEKDDPQPASVNTGEGAEGAERLQGVYGRYRRSRRKRKAWAARNPGNVAIRAELGSRLLTVARGELDGGGPVLDVGCGNGRWLAELARAGVQPSRLHGVDLLEDRVSDADRILPAADVRLADARALPYRDEEFSLVLMLTLLSSLPDRAAIRTSLAEGRRVLAPGGLLLVYEPRLPNPLNRATTRVSMSDLGAALGEELRVTPLTVLPALARRLGRATPRLYPLLARVAPLLTHRLVAYRKPGSPGREGGG